MDGPSKTQTELIEEISALKERIRELEQSEEVLGLSQQRLQLLIDAGPDFFFLKNLDLCYQLVNSANARFFGRDEADILGRTDAELMPQGAAVACQDSDLQAIREKRMVVTIEQVGEKFYETHKFPVIVDGKIVGVAGIIRDITGQERAQEQLRQKTALLEAQLNASPDGIIIADKCKKFLENQLFKDLFRIPAHVAETDDNEARIEWTRDQVKNPEEFHEKVTSVFAHPDETIRDELELKDGRFLDMYSGPVVGRDGVRYGRIWTFRDMTERKRSEEALRASRLQLSEAMDLAHIVYWEFDSIAETFVFNDPFYTFYGTTAEQEGGYRMTREEYAKRFVHPDDQYLFYRNVEQGTASVAREFLGDNEHRIVRRDGEVRHILIRARIVRDDSGQIVARYGANQDITERRLAEEERERLILELQEALAKVKTLSRFLPICASCKKIRNDEGYWEQIEQYITDHSGALFSHGICPECMERLYPELNKEK